jgi:ABC-2 type transport system ATP-binding protein
MRQRVAIARALLHEPQIVFLDEPTAGLDPEAARTVRTFIAELRQGGRTVFLTTHNLAEADELCDQVAVFRTRLLQVGAPGELRTRLFGRGTVVRLAGEASAWRDMVARLPFVRAVAADGQALTVALDDPDGSNPALVQALVQAGAPVRYVEALAHSLEDVYLELLERAE